jgi:DNA polymerase III delta prime subunit
MPSSSILQYLDGGTIHKKNVEQRLKTLKVVKSASPPNLKKERVGFVDWEQSLYNSKISEKKLDNNDNNLWDSMCRPTKLDEVLGQENAKKQLIEWINIFSIIQPLKKNVPVLICGPPGCGKTSLARCILLSKNYKIWDESLLQSENNTLEDLLRIANSGSSIYNVDISLKKLKKNAVLIECLEGLSDGERSMLLKFIKSNPQIPLIITCDDPYDSPNYAPFLKCCKPVYMKMPELSISSRILQNAAKRNGKPLSLESCETVLEASNKNPRQAINSLQFLMNTKHRKKNTNVAASTSSSALAEMDKIRNKFLNIELICCGIYRQDIEDIANSDLEISLCMLQENVAGCCKNDILICADAMDGLSLSDILYQEYDKCHHRYAMEFASIIGLLAVANACKGSARKSKIQFTQYFSKRTLKFNKWRSLRMSASYNYALITNLLQEKSNAGIKRKRLDDEEQNKNKYKALVLDALTKDNAQPLHSAFFPDAITCHERIFVEECKKI